MEAALQRYPKLYPIIRRVHQILACSQVPFGRLNGGMPKQHLDLLQLPARSPTQLRAGAATVVGGDFISYNAGRQLGSRQSVDR
jgi:hypothetical protein